MCGAGKLSVAAKVEVTEGSGDCQDRLTSYFSEIQNKDKANESIFQQDKSDYLSDHISDHVLSSHSAYPNCLIRFRKVAHEDMKTAVMQLGSPRPSVNERIFKVRAANASNLQIYSVSS